MSDHQLPEDDDWLASMLEADRDVPSVAPSVEARMLARLEADLGTGVPDGAEAADGADAGGPDVGPDAATPGPATAGDLAGGTGAVAQAVTAAGGVSQLLAIACAVSLALGGVLGYAAHDLVSPPAVTGSPAEGAVVATPVLALGDAGVDVTPAPPSDALADDQAADPAAPDGGMVGAPPSPRRGTADASTGANVAPTTPPELAAGSDDAGAATAPTRDEALADENALITQAQSALARGRASEALAALRDHQRRFPAGRFVEEREAMTVQALARTGQTDAARARAERFHARYPNSLLTRAVRAAVQEP